MTRPLAVLVPVAAAAVLILALTGCTPGSDPTPSGSASTPSAIITGAAADTAVPQPIIDFDCNSLGASAAFGAAYGAVLHRVDPVLRQSDIPDADVLQTLGGVSCEWSNGVPFGGGGGGGGTLYVGVQLAVLPNAASQWAHYDSTYGAAGEGVQCNSTAGALDCWSEQLVGTNWVSLTMFGVSGEAQARALAAATATAVSSAGPGAPVWTPPSGTTIFGDCTQLLTPSQVATDLGVTGATIQFTHGAGGWSIEAAARENADAVGCLFQYAGEDSVAGQVNWLRGGGWAYDAGVAASGWGTPAAAPIAGLASGDRAMIRCTDPSTSEEGGTVCTVDLELGGNWIQVVVAPYPGEHATADVRTASLAIATHLVSGYNAHAH